MRASHRFPHHRFHSFHHRVPAAAVALTIGLLALVTAAPSAAADSHTAATDLQRIEQLMYATAMPDFVTLASAGDGWLDATTDFCSAPLVGTTGRSFDFHGACRRHDFGYRNLKLLDQRYATSGTYWNLASRKRVDRQFLADMKAHCRTRSWYDEPTCLTWAGTFYAAVRVAGGP